MALESAPAMSPPPYMRRTTHAPRQAPTTGASQWSPSGPLEVDTPPPVSASGAVDLTTYTHLHRSRPHRIEPCPHRSPVTLTL